MTMTNANAQGNMKRKSTERRLFKVHPSIKLVYVNLIADSITQLPRNEKREGHFGPPRDTDLFCDSFEGGGDVVHKGFHVTVQTKQFEDRAQCSLVETIGILAEVPVEVAAAGTRLDQGF